MKNFRVILAREVLALWRSPLAWTLLGVFALLAGLIFFNLLEGYVTSIQSIPANMQSQVSFTEEVLLRLYGNLNFFMVFFIPPLTMRLLAEERRQGTLDLLWAAPVTDSQIVLAKFVATWAVGAALLLPTLIFPAVMFWAGSPEGALLWTSYLGLICNLALYSALGLFASALTESAVVAALLGVVFNLGTWMMSWIAQVVENFQVAEALRYLSVTPHYENLARGLVISTDLFYYFFAVTFALYLTVSALATRNWS